MASNAVVGSDLQVPSEALAMLDNFWPKVMDNIQNINIHSHFKTQELPLARIKKIMKLDEDVKMISAEAPVLFAKACEIFIAELSLRSWIHTEDNKRRTLQKNDVSQAVSKYDQFDFLIDIVPRDEIKPTKRDENLQRTSLMPDQVQYYFQLAQQTQQALQQQQTPAPQPQQIQIQTGGGQILSSQQLQQLTQQVTQATAQAVEPQVIQIQAPQEQTTQDAHVVQQIQQAVLQQDIQDVTLQDQPSGTQVFQQVVTPSGDVIHMPIELSSAQLQAIQSQMQGKQPGQPIVIQTGSEQHEQQLQHELQQQQEQPQPLFQLPLSGDNQQLLIQDSDQSDQMLTIKGER